MTGNIQLILIFLPIFAGLLCFFIKNFVFRASILISVSVLHLAFSLFALFFLDNNTCFGSMLGFDRIGLLLLCLTSLLFLFSAIYAVGYINEHKEATARDDAEGFIFPDSPHHIFLSCMLFFLSAMTLVFVARNFGVLWVGIEATTFASAPLIYYYHHHRSLEAVWKYVMICSVGIGFSLIGNILLLAAFPSSVEYATLSFSLIKLHVMSLDPVWIKAAFVFFLIGYGTKAGLAPMHSWLPSAYGEAPGFISALLSGALLNCAFLGIFRAHEISCARGSGVFSGNLLILLGVISTAVSAIMMIGQKDYKKMVAYSSIEHIGLASIGLGLGAPAIFATVLHLINHSLSKAMLFLISSNIFSFFGSRKCSDVKGLSRTLPLTGFLWMAGFFAIAGTPPFGLFVSEFLIFKEMFAQSRYLVAILVLIFLGIIFAFMAKIMIEMSFGKKDESLKIKKHEALYMIIPPFILLFLTFMLGIFIPASLLKFIEGIKNAFIQ